MQWDAEWKKALHEQIGRSAQVPIYVPTAGISQHHRPLQRPHKLWKLELPTSLQSDSYTFYEIKFYLLCVSLTKKSSLLLLSDSYIQQQE